MRFNDVIKMSFKDLRRRKGRTFLTALAVAIGSMLIVTMVGLGTTAQKYIMDEVNKQGKTKYIQLSPEKYMTKEEREKSISMDASPEEFREYKDKIFKKIDDSTLKTLKNINGVDEVQASVTDYLSKVKLDGKEYTKEATILNGTNTNYSIFTKNQIASVKKSTNNNSLEPIYAGRNLSSSDKNAALVNIKLLKDMGITDFKAVVGKEITLSLENFDSNVGLNPLEMKAKVVGVVNEAYDNDRLSSIIVPLEMASDAKAYSSLNKNYFNEKGYSTVSILAKNSGDVTGICDEIKKIGFTYYCYEDIAKEVKSVFTTIEQILSLLGIIVLFVAALGTVNTMTMAIHERTKSIGIMKSVGASRENIHNIFLTQAAAIGFIGGVMGLFFSFINSKIIEAVLKSFLSKQGVKEVISFSMPTWLVLGSLIFAVFISLISGIYPARKASKLDAIQALNS